MGEQVVQVVGALLVLTGFLAAQVNRLDQRSWAYLAVNAAGSSVLAATAVLHADWGFVFLEGTWAVVSFVGIAARLRGRNIPVAH